MLKQICLNRSVLEFMASVIPPDGFVLEFGSGWSTRWFADRCARLLSIETDPDWADRVCDDLVGSACQWELRLVDDMLQAVDGVEQVDLVLLDGEERFRKSCAQLSWPLLKAGGWLVLDDAQREIHQGAVQWLGQFGAGRRLEWQAGDLPSARERLSLTWQKP